MKNDLSLKKATMINAISRYATILCNLFFTAILARLLTPKDYGVIAVIAVFTTFFSIFSDMGIGAGVIQNKSLTDEEMDGIFSFSTYIAIALGLTFSLFSIPLSLFYNNDVYKPVGCLLAISLAFSTVNIVPNAILMRNKRFILVAVRGISVSILTSLMAVAFAYMGFKYYALVLQSLLSSILTFFWNFMNMRKEYSLKFHFRYSKQGLVKIRYYSGFQFAFNFVNFFSRNLDNLLISKFMGVTILGFYDKAYKLALYPIQNLTHVITPAIHPILSEHQDDMKYIYEKYRKLLRLLSLSGVFISIFCSFYSGELILLFFGNQWGESIPIFQILAISIWAQMTTSSIGSIFQSLGETRSMFFTGSINSFIMVVSILIGVVSGKPLYLAIMVCISFYIAFLISYYQLIKKVLFESVATFALSFKIDFLIATIFIIANLLVNQVHLTNVLLSFVIHLLASGIIYIFLLIATKQHTVFLNIIKRK